MVYKSKIFREFTKVDIMSVRFFYRYLLICYKVKTRPLTLLHISLNFGPWKIYKSKRHPCKYLPIKKTLRRTSQSRKKQEKKCHLTFYGKLKFQRLVCWRVDGWENNWRKGTQKQSGRSKSGTTCKKVEPVVRYFASFERFRTTEIIVKWKVKKGRSLFSR